MFFYGILKLFLQNVSTCACQNRQQSMLPSNSCSVTSPAALSSTSKPGDTESTLQPVVQHQHGCLQAPGKNWSIYGRPNSCERTFLVLLTKKKVGKTNINHPMFDALYDPFMVMTWGWFNMVLTCFNYIRSESRQVETILVWFDMLWPINQRPKPSWTIIKWDFFYGLATWTSWSNTRWQVIQ